MPVAGAAHAQDEVVARGAGAAVTRAEVAGLSRSLSPEGRARLLADAAARDRVVRTLLAQKAVLAEAKAKGWDKQPLVQAAIEQAQREVLLQSYGGAQRAGCGLSAGAGDPGRLRAQPSHLHGTACLAPPSSMSRCRPVPTRPPSMARRRSPPTGAAGAGARRRLRGPAKMYSEDKASAARGGDLGFVPETMIQPAVLAAANALKRGEVSAPVRTPTGFHVLKLVEVREAACGRSTRSGRRSGPRCASSARSRMCRPTAKLAAADAVSIDDEALKKALVPSQ